ncbi:MAG: valine--tRNA ligase [Acholeplasmataceae bacterium]|nr:valine--tRNA ligase [Acholeplasmataceae bacterium]
MTKLSTKYQFKDVEKGRYRHWRDQGFFKSGLDLKKPPFTIVIPPPNVTGKLHLGHAWDNTLQDTIVRRMRMKGYDTLYLPGMDHAGIATQAKIEAHLKAQGISKYDLGREAFLDHAWAWKEEYAEHIADQWAALGNSLDYDKERFTLDEGLNDAVNHVFLELYKRGYIYRGYRIINWDVEAKTAISNIEVEYEETKGKLYYFNYPFIDGSGHLTIATTRPETMFADQALMVHPDDERYQDMVGKQVYIPGTNVQIPVIIDKYVDMEFGTGVVKVTPAHDANDFEVGERHQLAMPLCMEEDGTMNQMAFQYEGMDRFACREALVRDLEGLGLVHHIEDYVHSLSYSERTGVVVEPRLSLQWFVQMDVLAKQALEKTKVKFVPRRFKKIYENWLTEPHDWCISRQLWWGHRIPAWYRGEEVKVQVESPGVDWVQDEDVLDTWFSSALWPFSTLGWPEETEDFKRYYPTQVMVTGYDIIFFWVARMIFQGLEFTGQDPFDTVLIHGLIRDAKGRKMSKSLDNGVDPMDVIDQYGVDALRYFLTTNSAPGQDLRYEPEKVESSWNFINKLWNIARFIMLNTEDYQGEKAENYTLTDRWILSRLSETIQEADVFYDRFEFGEVAKVLYPFIWDDFASWYVEFAKIALADPSQKATTQAVLLKVLKAILKLMHPFIPFVTEKLFLEITDEPTIMLSKWPEAEPLDQEALSYFSHVQDVIVKIRNLRAEHQVAPKKPLAMTLVISDQKDYEILSHYHEIFVKFLNSDPLTVEKVRQEKDDAILITGSKIETYVLKADLIDEALEKETLEKQKVKLLSEIKRSEGLLNNKQFVAKAPKEKLDIEKAKYEDYRKQYEQVLEKLAKYV